MITTDGEPTRYETWLAHLALSLEQHETRGFDPARVSMLSPMSVGEKNVTICIQKIQWPKSPEFAGERRHNRESFAERRRCIWPRPDRCDPVEEHTKGALGVRFSDRVESLGLELGRFEDARKIAIVCK